MVGRLTLDQLVGVRVPVPQPDSITMEVQEIINVLSDPKIYPEKPKKIELRQTHISLVFLTGKYAYKVKKPVNFDFLDYSTLEKRKHFCEIEITLNQRLSPEVYLGTVAITKDKDRFYIDGPGEIIEYAVKMRQLPEEQMMDKLLPLGKVSLKDIDRIAKKIADFHKLAETNAEIEEYGTVEANKVNTDENFAQTEKYIDLTIPRYKYEEIKAFTNLSMERRKNLFERRIKEGKIRDCHGDLHSRNICITEKDVYIYDCIEFNKRFRYGDTASEVAFLAMDLDFHKRPELSNYFIEKYIEYSEDKDLVQLLPFYKCYRAYVRGKVTSFMGDSFYDLAQKYFNLAYRYVKQSRKPLIIVFSGLPGTGKSYLAEKLASRLDFKIINSDKVRKQLAGIPLFEHRFEEFKTGIYSKDFSIRTYMEMIKEAKAILNAQESVILDATFRKREERKRVIDLAKEFLFIECTCPKEVMRQRLLRRETEKAVSDARIDLFEKLEKDYEPYLEIPSQNFLSVDTSMPEDTIMNNLLQKIWQFFYSP